MPDEKGVAAGKRFARDMRRVREDRGVSLATIHEQTQIAESLLDSFEKGGLYDHSAFNEVYLRSFVRAYATAVGISTDEAVVGLKAAIQGEYQNALAVKYLQEPPASSAVGGAHEESEDESRTSSDSPDSEEVDLSQDPSASQKKEPLSPGAETDNEANAEGTGGPQEATTIPNDAAKRSPHTSSKVSREGGRGKQLWNALLPIGATLLVLVVFGFGVWYTFGTGDPQSGSSSPSGQDTLSESTAPSSVSTSASTVSASTDTSQSPSSRSESPSAPPALGDTLHLTLRADSTISGLRMRRDEDLRRPYWIRQGEAAAFPFTTRAIIENDLDDVTVFLENRRVELSPDTAGRVVLDRQRAAALLENIEDGPAEWSTPPDTIAVGPLSSDSTAS